MIIIDNTKPPIPKYSWTPKPSFRTTLDRVRYWENEKVKWREGFAGVSGMHYFYMQECWIKKGTGGDYIRPNYRDCDEWIINDLHSHYWDCKGAIGLVKRREIGATSIGSALLPMYTFRNFPGSTFGMTSCDKDRIHKAFEDKTLVALDNMDVDIRPTIERKNATKTQTYLKLGIKTKDIDGNDAIRYSDFFSKQTSDAAADAKGFSSTRMRAAYYDEFPLHRFKRDLLSSSRPCFMEGPVQTGFLLWGGTVEQGITPEQIAELKQIVEDSEYMDTKVIFAPAWWGLFMDEGGVSDEKKGIEWVMREREKKSKLSDPTELNNFIKNYPLNLEEIFSMGGSGKFEEDVIQKVNETITRLSTTDKPDILPVTLINMGNDKIEYKVAARSHTTILEHPKPSIQYIFGNDGTGTTKESGVIEGSNIAGVIVKMFDPEDPDSSYTPIAIYTERPKSFEDSYIKSENLIKYYAQYGNMKIRLQSNQANEHFGAFLSKHGLGRYIKMRSDLSGKGNVNKNKMGTFITPDVIEWQYRQANYILRRYGHNFKMKALLQEILLPYDTNTDILDAWLMCLIEMGIDFDKVIEKKVKPPKKRLVWNDTLKIYEYENTDERWDAAIIEKRPEEKEN